VPKPTTDNRHPTRCIESPLTVYSVEKPGFSVLGLFRQLVIESVNCQQDSVQPTKANSGEAIVVER
jgi:hypothetical protein